MALKKLLLLLSVVAAGFTLNGCRESEQPSCRALFEKYYEANVQRFMETMPADVDSLTARKRIDSILNRLYEIDSTFVLNGAKEQSKFMDEHFYLLEECDSIR